MKDDFQIFFHKLLIAISFDLKVQNEAIKIITNELNQINDNATQVFESLKLITKKWYCSRLYSRVNTQVKLSNLLNLFIKCLIKQIHFGVLKNMVYSHQTYIKWLIKLNSLMNEIQTFE